jgi:hypothetical protein
MRKPNSACWKLIRDSPAADPMSRVIHAAAAPIVLLSSIGVSAHVMGVVYNLPIPFWMYAFAASAALVLSFLVVGFFVTAIDAARNFRTLEVAVPCVGAHGIALRIARVLSVFALVLTIWTGLAGPTNPSANLSITFFWVIFALGFSYLTALMGDLYALINPWRVICDWIGRLGADAFRARMRYPRWLGYYPALAFYMAFIWLELFGQVPPRVLGLILLAYSLVNIGAAALFSPQVWFHYGEMFSVFLRLIGKIAPFDFEPGPAGSIRLRQPFIGLLQEPADHFSLMLFVLFMLSSTAFDGVHDTLPWALIFWRDLYPLLSSLIHQPYLFFVHVYYGWQWAMLFASPFIYLAIYLVFVSIMKVVTASERSVRDLALQFAFSLIPIAFVYNVSHYYTLLVGQGPAIFAMISDPFGAGWDLLGTARKYRAPTVLAANGVWHTQVGLILFGHIVSVYLAHVRALELFPKGRQGILSQLPMLMLMVLLTTIGLRILSLPIAAGQVQDPVPTNSATSARSLTSNSRIGGASAYVHSNHWGAVSSTAMRL